MSVPMFAPDARTGTITHSAVPSWLMALFAWRRKFLSSQLDDPPVARDAVGRSASFEILVDAEASGEASADDRALLEANKDLWRDTLERLLDDTEDGLDSVRTLTGPERDQVVADFKQERDRLAT